MQQILSTEIQRMFDGRLREVEEGGRRLLRDLRVALGGDHRRAIGTAGDKLDVALTGMEDLIYASEGAPEGNGTIERIHDASDQLIRMRAQLDRTRRGIRRESEQVALDRRALTNRQVSDELEAELALVEDLTTGGL